MPRLDRYPLSKSLSMESTSMSRARSTSWCCNKTAARRTSFKAPKTNNLSDQFDMIHNCSSSTDQDSSSASMGSSPFLIFQRCFQGGAGCPCTSSIGYSCFRTRELEDMSVTIINETSRKKKKKKVHQVRLMNDIDQKALLDLQRAAAAAAAAHEQVRPIVLVFKTEKPMEDGKFIWADKYRPKLLMDFICHRETAAMLLTLVRSEESSHCILEGPPGLGKRTLIQALLREYFGAEGIETREKVKEFKVEEGPVSSIQMNAQVSSNHIEVDLSELNGYAVQVVVELIKEAHTLFNHDDINIKQAIILYGAGILSMDDQLQVRSCLENYKGHYKVYFCSSGVSKLQHIESLCTVIQILPPSNEQIISVLEFVAHCEGIELPRRLADNIAEKSKHSIQQAIRSFEATWQLNYPFKEDQMIMTGWEEELEIIANCIINEQSPKQLYIIREKLKNFMVHNVSPETICKSLVEELNKLLNYPFQVIITELIQDGGLIDQNLRSIQKKFRGGNIGEPVKRNAVLFLRIEEFIAKFMSIYKIMSQKEQWKGEIECVV